LVQWDYYYDGGDCLCSKGSIFFFSKQLKCNYTGINYCNLALSGYFENWEAKNYYADDVFVFSELYGFILFNSDNSNLNLI
jgi:hypothetical protein